MKTKDLVTGTWYECKYRTTEPSRSQYYGGYYTNYEKLTPGVAKLLKIKNGYGASLHVLELKDGTKVFATSNSIIKKASGSGKLPTEDLESKLQDELSTMQVEKFGEYVEICQKILAGLGVQADLSDKKQLIISPIETKKLELVLKKCFAHFLMEES